MMFFLISPLPILIVHLFSIGCFFLISSITSQIILEVEAFMQIDDVRSEEGKGSTKGLLHYKAIEINFSGRRRSQNGTGCDYF